jgi:hypothetical protein
MKRHRLASPILALGIGAIAVLAAAGGSFAVSPNLAAPAVEAPTAACSTVPLDVEIILDTSGSMGSNPSGSPSHTRLYWAEAAATQLVNQLDANGGVGGASGLHHVGLTRFSDTTSTVVLALGTSTAMQVNTAISGLTTSNGTPFKTGMSTGAGDLSADKRTTANGLTVQHVIVFLSDGRPDPDQGPNGALATTTSGQRPTAANLASFQAPADTIYSIAIGSGGGSGSNLVDLLVRLLQRCRLEPPADALQRHLHADRLPNRNAHAHSDSDASPNRSSNRAPGGDPDPVPVRDPQGRDGDAGRDTEPVPELRGPDGHRGTDLDAAAHQHRWQRLEQRLDPAFRIADLPRIWRAGPRSS